MINETESAKIEGTWEANKLKYLSFLIKPASSICNLRCRYCFYEDESEKRAIKSMGIMTEQTAEKIILKAFEEIEPGGSISFMFQGGE